MNQTFQREKLPDTPIVIFDVKDLHPALENTIYWAMMVKAYKRLDRYVREQRTNNNYGLNH